MRQLDTIEGIRSYADESGGIWYLLADVREAVRKPKATATGPIAYVYLDAWPKQRRMRLINRAAVLEIMRLWEFEHPHRYWRTALDRAERKAYQSFRTGAASGDVSGQQ